MNLFLHFFCSSNLVIGSAKWEGPRLEDFQSQNCPPHHQPQSRGRYIPLGDLPLQVLRLSATAPWSAGYFDLQTPTPRQAQGDPG